MAVERFWHNHEKKMIRDRLQCYKLEAQGMKEGASHLVKSNRYLILRGKIELCEELLGANIY